MLRRKIATAEADLAETHRLTIQLAPPADSPSASLAAEKQQIKQALAAARAQRDRMSTQLQDQVAPNPASPRFSRRKASVARAEPIL